MKVAITGHTNGIGLGLHNYFVEKGHEVLGFSRSNGYTMPEANDRILSQIIDCDLFVNNSEPVNSQIFFLQPNMQLIFFQHCKMLYFAHQ